MENQNFQKECDLYCKDVAETVEAYADKKMYRCPECDYEFNGEGREDNGQY